MKAPRFLKSETVSRCHSSPTLLVRSRDGGLVTRNCLKCGRPDYVRMEHLPKLKCETCYGELEAGTNRDRNYQYSCSKCVRVWCLPDMLPDWSELFEYCGLFAVEGPKN
jgi:hypothetical protein